MQNMGRHSCQRSAILWKTSQAGSTSVMTLQTRYTKSTNHILKHCKNCDLCPLSPFDCHKWYDLNSSICQELSSLSQSQEIIISLLCRCHFYCFFCCRYPRQYCSCCGGHLSLSLVVVFTTSLFLSMPKIPQHSRTNLQRSEDSEMKSGSIDSHKVTYWTDLDNERDLIKLTVYAGFSLKSALLCCVSQPPVFSFVSESIRSRPRL